MKYWVLYYSIAFSRWKQNLVGEFEINHAHDSVARWKTDKSMPFRYMVVEAGTDLSTLPKPEAL